VVFVAGSGPTDRDWCSPLLPGKNGSGKLLAEYLASQGFLTLRYDKIASGPHAQENVSKMIGKISMQSHVDELSGAVNTLEGADSLFALTNSEGAIHALNYQLQAKTKFKGMVLTGAPGRSIGKVARTQIVNQLASLPNRETIIKQYDASIASFVNGKPVVPDSALPEGIKQLLLSLITPANLPFARELWAYDPSEVISKIKEPILVIIGKKDIQVDWQVDGKTLEVAVAGK
jgi:pimeloyl-ACP methyl ester carboxylesterase